MQFDLKLFYEFPFEGEAFNISKGFFKAYSDGKTLKVEIIPKLSAETIEEFNKTLSLIEQIGKVWLNKALEEIFKSGPVQTIENHSHPPEKTELTDNSEKMDIGLPKEETTLKTEPTDGSKEEKEEIPLADLIEGLPKEETTLKTEPTDGSKEEKEEIPLADLIEGLPKEETTLKTEPTDGSKEEKEEIPLADLIEGLPKEETTLKTEPTDGGKEEKEEIPLADLIEGLPKEETTLKTEPTDGGKEEKEGGGETQQPFRRKEEESIENFLSEEERRLLEETFKNFQEKFK